VRALTSFRKVFNIVQSPPKPDSARIPRAGTGMEYASIRQEGLGNTLFKISINIACNAAEIRPEYKYIALPLHQRGRDSSVGIATGWKAEVRLPAVQDFYLLHSVQTHSGGQPSLLSNGYRGLFHRG
jgi:hypothetical protein